jgi:uncharacterized protein YdhG (YjbR/CyaY superfamily)
MTKAGFKSVDEYIAAEPGPLQLVLRRTQTTVRKALPGAEKTISYQIPTYKLQGRAVSTGWKQHYSLYPRPLGLLRDSRMYLAGFVITKGTIRFPLTEEVPVKSTRLPLMARSRPAWAERDFGSRRIGGSAVVGRE